MIQFFVESGTFYGAAATLLSANEAEPAVDDYTFIYQLDQAPARQLAEQWPSLPETAQASSGEGEGLLSAARDRTGWKGQEASERQEQATPRLYDQWGHGIQDGSRLTEIFDDDDAVWLVPALALTESIDEAEADRQVSSVPTKQQLDCRNC